MVRCEQRREAICERANKCGWMDGWTSEWKKKHAIAGRLFCALEMLKSKMTFYILNIYISIDWITQNQSVWWNDPSWLIKIAECIQIVIENWIDKSVIPMRAHCWRWWWWWPPPRALHVPNTLRFPLSVQRTFEHFSPDASHDASISHRTQC